MEKHSKRARLLLKLETDNSIAKSLLLRIVMDSIVFSTPVLVGSAHLFQALSNFSLKTYHPFQAAWLLSKY